jgi:hypothetical protein
MTPWQLAAAAAEKHSQALSGASACGAAAASSLSKGNAALMGVLQRLWYTAPRAPCNINCLDCRRFGGLSPTCQLLKSCSFGQRCRPASMTSQQDSSRTSTGRDLKNNKVCQTAIGGVPADPAGAGASPAASWAACAPSPSSCSPCTRIRLRLSMRWSTNSRRTAGPSRDSSCKYDWIG